MFTWNGNRQLPTCCCIQWSVTSYRAALVRVCEINSSLTPFSDTFLPFSIVCQNWRFFFWRLFFAMSFFDHASGRSIFVFSPPSPLRFGSLISTISRTPGSYFGKLAILNSRHNRGSLHRLLSEGDTTKIAFHQVCDICILRRSLEFSNEGKENWEYRNWYYE